MPSPVRQVPQYGIPWLARMAAPPSPRRAADIGEMLAARGLAASARIDAIVAERWGIGVRPAPVHRRRRPGGQFAPAPALPGPEGGQRA